MVLICKITSLLPKHQIKTRKTAQHASDTHKPHAIFITQKCPEQFVKELFGTHGVERKCILTIKRDLLFHISRCWDR